MPVHDRWEVVSVLPDEWLEFNDWVIQKEESFPTVIVYHKHSTREDNGMTKVTLFMVNSNQCRQCGAQAPPGVLFLSKTSRLDGLGVE